MLILLLLLNSIEYYLKLVSSLPLTSRSKPDGNDNMCSYVLEIGNWKNMVYYRDMVKRCPRYQVSKPKLRNHTLEICMC